MPPQAAGNIQIQNEELRITQTMPADDPELTPADIARYGQNYLIEMDGIELYRLLAEAEKNEKRAANGTLRSTRAHDRMARPTAN